MAIRAGSGGLKYAPPNQAEITARQSAAAASAGGSASASAYGANRRYAGLKKSLQHDAQQSYLDRGFKAQQSGLDRGFRAQQDQNSMRFRADAQLEGQKFSAGQQTLREKAATTAADVRNDRSQLDFDRDIDAGIEDDIRSGKLERPKELKDLDSGYAASKTDPKWEDPQWRADIEDQYKARRRKLLRGARRSEAPTRDDILRKALGPDYDPSLPYHVDPRGNVSILDVPDSAADKAAQKQAERMGMLADDALKIMKETSGGTDPELTFGDYDDALAEAERRKPQGGGNLPASTYSGVLPPTNTGSEFGFGPNSGGRQYSEQPGVNQPQGAQQVAEAAALGDIPQTQQDPLRSRAIEAMENGGPLATPSTLKELDSMEPGTPFTIPDGINKGQIGYAPAQAATPDGGDTSGESATQPQNQWAGSTLPDGSPNPQSFAEWEADNDPQLKKRREIARKKKTRKKGATANRRRIAAEKNKRKAK